MRRALRRTTTCLALATLLPLLPAPVGAQAADPVRRAKAEVAAMQAQVDAAAAKLTRGTRRLERSQAELADVQRRLTRAQRDAGAAQGRATQARAQLRLVVAAAYKSPVPDSFVLALSGPDEFRAAMVAQADLHRVRSRQTDLLRDATTERVRARAAVRTVEQLDDDATRRARDVERQVKALQELAGRTERRLRTAAARLSAAESAQRAARARAVAVSAVAADCDGAATGGAANGFLSAASLCPLDGAPGAALRADAAAAFNRMTAAHRADRGAPLCVTDSYRTYRQQVSVYRRIPRLAAVPGTSRHGLGVALDLGCGVQRFGSPGYRWMKANGPRFGWIHPAWAEPSGSLPEPWHWEYVGG